MKLTLALFAVLLAVCHVKADVPAFTIDRQYRYAYKSRAVTGIAQNVMQFSGIGIKGDVILQNQGNSIFVKFDNVEYGNFNSKVNVNLADEFDMPYEPITGPYTFVKEALTKPVRVTVEKGLVKSFDVQPEDPEWSVNVKRAILTLFQLNFDRVNGIRFSKSNYLKPEDNQNFYRVMEDGIGGECETAYEIQSLPYYQHPYERVLNVTKHRMYDRCSHRPVNMQTTHMGYKCPGCGPQADPLKSVSRTEYQIRGDRSYFTIEKIFNTGKFLFTPFTTNSETVLSGVNQTLFLVETTPIRQAITFPEKYLTYTSLTYNLTDDTPVPTEVDLTKPNYYNRHFYHTYNNYKEQSYTLLKELAIEHDLTEDLVEKQVPQKLVELIKILGTLTFDEIKELYNSYMNFDYKTATPEKQRLRQAFFSTIPMVGTNPAIKFILYTLEKNLISSPRVAAEYFAALPLYVKDPSEKLIEAFLTYTKTVDKTAHPTLYSTMWLSFGTLVHRGCEQVSGVHDHTFHHGHDHVYRVQSETCKRYAKLLQQKFEEATNTWERLVFLQVANNMALPETYNFLRMIATGKLAYTESVRLGSLWSLYSLSHELKEEVLSIAVPIFSNHSESEKLRIAAFELILGTRPSFEFWQHVSERLPHEPSNQVQSYVYSTMLAYANSTDPCDKSLRKDVRRVLEFIKPLHHGYQSSRFILFNTFNDKFNLGSETLISYFGSNESLVPEQIYIEQTSQILGYHFNYFSLGLGGKGFSRFYEQIFGANGIFAPLDENKSLLNIFRRHPRNVDTIQKELDEIKQAVNVVPREHEPIEGMMSYGAFSQVLGFRYFDESSIPSYKENGYFYLPKELPKMFRDGYKVNMQKMALIADVVYELPTEMGFPLTFSVQVPGFFALNGDVKLEFQPGFFPEDRSYKKPTNIKLTTHLKPMVHTQIVSEVGIKTPIQNTYGYGITHDTAIKFPLNLNFDYDLKEKKLHINYTPTKTPYEIFHFRVRPFTFADKETNNVALTQETTVKDIHYRPQPHVKEMSFGQQHFGAGIKIHRRQEQDWDSYSSLYKFIESFFTTKSRTFDAYEHSYNLIHRFYNGLKSMRDYFTFYPSLRPYEFKLWYEPSTENPTNDYDLTIDFDSYLKTSSGMYTPEPTGDHMLRVEPTFSQVYNVQVDLTANGAVPREYHVNLNVSYNKAQGQMPRKISLDYYRTPVPAYDTNPFKLCYRANLKTPQYNNYYYIDTTTEQKVEAIHTIQFGTDCANDKKIEVTATFEKTEEQKQFDANPTMYKTYLTCEEDKKQGYNYSNACWQYFMDYYTLRQYTFDVKYENLPPYVQKWALKMGTWFTHNHFTNIERVEFVKNPDGQLKIVANVSASRPAAVDIKAYKPTHNIYFNDIYYPDEVPHYQQINLRVSPFRKMLSKIFDYGLSPMCYAQAEHFHTFDHVEYHAPLSTCYHIFAKDCAKEERFTILLKKTNHPIYNKAMKFFLDNHKIEILAVGDNLVVRVDDVKQAVTATNLYYYADPEVKGKYIFLVKVVGSAYKIQAPKVGIDVLFNGDLIKVHASNTYRGHLCGLCGDLNGERNHEFTGPSGCVYHKETPFIYSYVVPDGSCTIPPKTEGEQCVYPKTPKYPGKCTIRRNKVIHDAAVDRSGRQSSNVCFSTLPIPECLASCKPTTYVKRRVGFHCLNTRDDYTSILIRESKTRELTELQNKSEDYYEVVQYPENCVKA